jgi:deoxyribodipyrimidine photo-lyase
MARDAAVESSLAHKGIQVEAFNAGTLFEAGTILSKGAHRPFQVFSAFWKACLAKPEPTSPLETHNGFGSLQPGRNPLFLMTVVSSRG